MNALRHLTKPLNLIDFSSNDYLGLARSAELAACIRDAASHHLSNGATGSRLLTGNSGYVEHVEVKLATLFHGEAALIFNSGYAANTAVLSSIPARGDTIIYDELAHASIKDGARLSLAERYPFRHNDLSDLESKLSRAKGHRFIVTESLYSMDGDMAPIKSLVELADRMGASLIVDEAHSTGIFGATGSGLSVSLGVDKQIPIRIYTFGKAMGVHGACVVGSRQLIDFLINSARPFIYSTALPVHSIVSIDQAFILLEKYADLQRTLWENVEVFCRYFPNAKHQSPIQPIIIPGNDEVRGVAQRLMENNFDVRPIISPTVKEGSERLRVVLHSFNTHEQIRTLTEMLTRQLAA
ncbi:MAG: aminotransferase class I/II-fold pyridoxal phosphate-dependent enzyme [Cyclobacteriaceae bacterium]